ncbi:hypothetical protein SDC9_141331 [bioreactor metagenome]|uniref:RNA polymerase sigma factor 70 region 4 type 2 domain-containing protein n=1 Tax=bioreactor metagenome TaxID=1076179 RepID=A0A645DXW4_9ZZZZ
MGYPDQNNPADLVIKMESYRRLHFAMNQLSEAQRRRIHLHFVNDLTHRKIAEMRVTGSHSIHRALKQLRM